MSFTVRLESDLVAVEPGVTTPLSIEVANRGDAPDEFELLVEGLDPEWTAVPVPMFTVEAHDIRVEKIFFKPARASESVAGNYPFVVKLRSLNSGEIRTAQGVLQVEPYNHLTMEILPKKGVISWAKKQNVFDVTIMNLGNTEITLQLFGSDPEDALAYEFEQGQITVGPGQQKEVECEAIPTTNRSFASPRLHGFNIAARGVENPGVSATASAQLEQRPFMSPGTLAMTLIVLAILMGWIALMPKKPVVDSFTPNKNTVLVGENVTVSWKTSHAKNVLLKFNGQLLQKGPSSGSFTMVATGSGTFELVAEADNRKSSPQAFSLEVQVPPEVPKAEVVSFSISPRSVGLGKMFELNYKLKDAIKATLYPTGTELDPNIQELKLTAPNEAGSLEYYIIAYNAKNEATQSRKITVRVVDETEAAIVVFRAEPQTVELAVAKTTLTWQASNAARTELYAGAERIYDTTDSSGEQVVDIFKTTVYKLVVFDSKGRSISQSITVKVKDLPPPDTTGTTAGGTTGTTGSSTTGTTATTTTGGG